MIKYSVNNPHSISTNAANDIMVIKPVYIIGIIAAFLLFLIKLRQKQFATNKIELQNETALGVLPVMKALKFQ